MAYQNRYHDDDDDDDYYKRQARRREQQRANRDPNVFVLSECCDDLCVVMKIVAVVKVSIQRS